MEIDSSLHIIEIPLPFHIGEVSVYLLEGAPLTLIDCGPKSDISLKAITRGLKEIGYGLRDIEKVVITHAHIDHFGLAGDIKEISHAQICLHENDKNYVFNFYDTWDKRIKGEKESLLKNGMPEPIFQKTYEYITITKKLGRSVLVDQVLKDGDEIAAGSFRLKVIHCPGHSASAVCLYEKEKKLLFSGDHILEKVSPNPFIPGPFTGLKNYLASVKKVEDLEVSLLLPGHGPPSKNFKNIIKNIYKNCKKRQDNIMELLDFPKTAYQISHELFGELPISEVWLGLAEMISHLEILRENSRVTMMEKDGLLWYEKRRISETGKQIT